MDRLRDAKLSARTVDALVHSSGPGKGWKRTNRQRKAITMRTIAAARFCVGENADKARKSKWKRKLRNQMRYVMPIKSMNGCLEVN